MPQPLAQYADEFASVATLRREDGILELRLHTNGGPFMWSEAAHRQLPELFYRIGDDPENHVVILTGTGDAFLADVDFTSWGGVRDAQVMGKVYREAKQLLWRLLDIDVPVIGVVNGPVRIHSELPLLSDVVLASEKALFQEGVHFTTGGIPGDGMHTLWQLWLGPNRGRYFLTMAQEITAPEALSLGLVSEVLPHDQVLDRAWEIARRFNERPFLSLRYTRLCLTLGLKRALFNELETGLAIESLGKVGMMSLYPLIRDEGLGDRPLLGEVRTDG